MRLAAGGRRMPGRLAGVRAGLGQRQQGLRRWLGWRRRLSDLPPEELQARASELFWFHRVELGHGVIAPGVADFSWRADQLPAVAGKSVLDIGAWDGGYSYLAERRGAARVVAVDDYVWGVDVNARDAYWRECAERGVLPDHDRDRTDFWRPDLPGRRAFDFAHEALNSAVKPLLADFSTMDLTRLGSFDVVFYLGVLYHMQEPLSSLHRVRQVTGEVAAIETIALNIPGRNHERLLQFHGRDELGADYGNWFVPTTETLRAMCLAAGFRKVDIVVGPPQPPTTLDEHNSPNTTKPAPLGHYRTLIHAYP